MTDIAIVVYDGFDELDAIGPYEVFSHAADAGADCEVSLVSLDPVDRVTASHGLRIEPDGGLESADGPERPDLLVVPGGGWSARDESAGAWVQAERGDLPDRLGAFHEAGVTLASVCTGGMLLAHAGVLAGRPAVTHASALEDLADYAGEVVDARLVDDGDVLTAGGITAGIDLALHLVGREFGEKTARRVETVMEYEPRSAGFSPKSPN